MQVEKVGNVDRCLLVVGLGGMGMFASSTLLIAGILSLAQHRLPSIRLGCLSTYILKHPKGAKIAASAMLAASAGAFLSTAGYSGYVLSGLCRKEEKVNRMKPPVVTVSKAFLQAEQANVVRGQYPASDERLMQCEIQSSERVDRLEVGYPERLPIEEMKEGRPGKIIHLSRETITLIHKDEKGKTTIYSQCPVYYEKQGDTEGDRYFLPYNLSLKGWDVFREMTNDT